MNQYEGAKCCNGHTLEWVAEGLGLCTAFGESWWWMWSVAPLQWGSRQSIVGRDGTSIPMWMAHAGLRREEAMARIQREIAARNAQPEAIVLTPGPSYQEYLSAVGR